MPLVGCLWHGRSAVVFRKGTGAGLARGKCVNPLASLIRSFPIPPLSPIPQTILALGHLSTPFPACSLAGLPLFCFGFGNQVCVWPLSLYVIDGSYLHGPRRAAVGVPVKPPDESFHRLETACSEPSLTLSLRIPYTILILREG
ncbi:hypothetical protein SCLCIDRAFT_860749 [Scleroderma citrinum Foug A]|uniref:Uncharacterized protein n=1 Tax=Scleroderma citrinum Foug A TaxID=1036808 RepID=A0A0C3E061_9AGAM|nr:hypothetical protein SCLCIDRAFT_860749 [Scleroderma citrinum Foug A]